MLKRWIIDKPNAKMKNAVIRLFFKGAWGPRREVPEVKPKSFNQQWKEMKGIK
jgi:L-lactate dehydrogenase complex protein LldF